MSELVYPGYKIYEDIKLRRIEATPDDSRFPLSVVSYIEGYRGQAWANLTCLLKLNKKRIG